MRSRVEEMVPECQDRVLLTTFHSFCADILRQHGIHVGIRPDFTILNQDADREAVLEDALAALETTGDETSDADARLLPAIDRLLANCVHESEAASKFRDAEFGARIGRVYSEYRRQLSSQNRLDFASLLILAGELLGARPPIAQQLRRVYRHVCVDEFQDTNYAQYRILRLLLGNDPGDLFVVADDDQIIYQWNGASPERLRELQDDFQMRVVQLPANYRCPAGVIELANRLISHNLDRAAGKEPLFAIKRGGTELVRVSRFESYSEELEWVAQDIRERHESETGGCAVLARTRRVLECAVDALERNGLEASLAVRKTEFTSAPVRWMHAVLRLANSRSDREQLRRICKSFYEIEGVEMEVRQLIAEAAQFGGDYLRAWFETAQNREGVEDVTRAFLSAGGKRILDRLDVLSFTDAALTWVSSKEDIMAGENPEGFADFVSEREAWKNLQAGIVQKYGRDNLTLNVFLQELDLSEKSPPPSPSSVRCLTIHSAKGMEFDHVYLVGLVEDQLPSFQSIKRGPDSREMQEERRNCFVAITRCQESLNLSYAREYFGWPKRPSRFLKEMGLEDEAES